MDNGTGLKAAPIKSFATARELVLHFGELKGITGRNGITGRQCDGVAGILRESVGRKVEGELFELAIKSGLQAELFTLAIESKVSLVREFTMPGGIYC